MDDDRRGVGDGAAEGEDARDDGRRVVAEVGAPLGDADHLVRARVWVRVRVRVRAKARVWVSRQGLGLGLGEGGGDRGGGVGVASNGQIGWEFASSRPTTVASGG